MDASFEQFLDGLGVSPRNSDVERCETYTIWQARIGSRGNQKLDDLRSPRSSCDDESRAPRAVELTGISAGREEFTNSVDVALFGSLLKAHGHRRR